MVPSEPNWSKSERLDLQIQSLLDKEAIHTSKECEGQFLSSIFLIPKPDRSSRFILNLKKFNEFIKTEHFKLENTRTARGLI